MIAMTQFAIIFLVLFFALINLTLGRGDSNIWLNILIGTFGYLIPSPVNYFTESVKGKQMMDKKVGDGLHGVANH